MLITRLTSLILLAFLSISNIMLEAKSAHHEILRCPIDLYVRLMLLKEATLSWANPTSCTNLFFQGYKFFGGRKRSEGYGIAGVRTVFWVVWLERTRASYSRVVMACLNELFCLEMVILFTNATTRFF